MLLAKGGKHETSRPNGIGVVLFYWWLEIDFHPSRFAISIGSEAAPDPLIWFADQSALDWVVVYVIKFFCFLALRPDVEVVKAALPEMVILDGRKLPKTPLRGLTANAPSAENPSSKTLFQHLYHDGWVSFVRFAD